MVYVSWWEAMAYCRWLSDQRGTEIRLPSESDWFAAAKHPDGEYPWGMEEPDEEVPLELCTSDGRSHVGNGMVCYDRRLELGVGVHRSIRSPAGSI